MTWELIFQRQPAKFLKKVEGSIFSRLEERLSRLADDPLPSEARQVVGTSIPTFRVRVGDWRIVYQLDRPNEVVVVHRIDKRSKVYER